MKQAAPELKGEAAVAMINLDENRELGAKYGVQSIPIVVVLKNGEEISRIRPRSKDGLLAEFRALK